ncbi:MAG TPA: hypothetical protein VHK90_08260 [Thermoanaerobaculia bacterium]|nr:hypothetical protein [Thermoanaerobaculia bacterium]
MFPIRSLAASAIVLALSTSAALAEGAVQQKTRVQFGGVVGGIVNVFGGKAAREGVTSNVAVEGDRMLTSNDRGGELVDLGEEKIYRLDYGRKSYSVVTFDELRKQYEEAKKEAAANAENAKNDKKSEGPDYEIDFDVDETGQKQTINGFDTRQVVVTVTVREKGKKLEQSGGAVLTADLWMGPKVPALREIAAFQQKYFKQLYGDPLAEMQQMAVLMATTPAFAKAMKEFSKKRAAFEGDAIRTTLTFESVAAPGQQAQEEEGSTGLVGGLIRGAMKKHQEKNATPGRSRMFESTTELLSASNDAGEVGVPAGFRER